MILTDGWKRQLFDQARGGNRQAKRLLQNAGFWSEANDSEILIADGKPADLDVLRIHRERQTILYIAATERGDLEVIDEIFNEASGDPELGAMLDDANTEMLTDEDRQAAKDLLDDLKSKEN